MVYLGLATLGAAAIGAFFAAKHMGFSAVKRMPRSAEDSLSAPPRHCLKTQVSSSRE